eukprot:1181933-Prorocentrum_minimum.AAC.2
MVRAIICCVGYNRRYLWHLCILRSRILSACSVRGHILTAGKPSHRTSPMQMTGFAFSPAASARTRATPRRLLRTDANTENRFSDDACITFPGKQRQNITQPLWISISHASRSHARRARVLAREKQRIVQRVPDGPGDRLTGLVCIGKDAALRQTVPVNGGHNRLHTVGGGPDHAECDRHLILPVVQLQNGMHNKAEKASLCFGCGRHRMEASKRHDRKARLEEHVTVPITRRRRLLTTAYS